MRNRALRLLPVAVLLLGALILTFSAFPNRASGAIENGSGSPTTPLFASTTQPAAPRTRVPADVQALFGDGISAEEFVQIAGYVPNALADMIEGDALMIIEFEAEPLAVRAAAEKAAGRALSAGALQSYRQSLLDAQAALAPQIESLGATIISNYATVYNGMQVRTPLNKLNELRALPGVKALHRAPVHEANLAGSVPLINAPAVWNDLGYQGEGMVIAIIDTGIDYTHAVFGGSGIPADYTANNPRMIEPGSFPTAKVIGGYDFAGTLYNAGCTPAQEAAGTCSTIPQPDRDPLDENRHGTHVASISAGEAAGAVADGVAPEAKLMALKVFGRSGSTSLTIDALDFATYSYLMFGYPHVINMSLGSNFGTDDPINPSVAGANNAAAAGISVIASAGNASDFSYITGAPGSASKVLSVAASEDGYSRLDGFEVTAPPALAGVHPALQSVNFNWSSPILPVSGALVYPAPGDNPAQDQRTGCYPFNAANAALISGNIVLIDWNTPSCAGSVTRAANAVAAGAIGVFMIDDSAVFDLLIAGSAVVPAYSIPLGIGNALKGALATGPVGVVMTAAHQGSVPFNEPAAVDIIASFSSRGPRGYDSALKPEVTAPGGSIFAANMGSGTGGVSLNGTSMAAPHVAGVAALMLQANPTWTPEQIKAAIMNTAVPLRDNTPIVRAGSGRIDAYRAVNTDVFAVGDADLVSLSFGVSMSRNNSVTRTKTATVYNWSAAEMAYDVAVGFQAGSSTLGATVSVSPTQITVPAGGMATVDVTIVFDMTQIPVRFDAVVLEEYYGLLTFTPMPTLNGTLIPDLVLPFYAQARPYSQLETITSDGPLSSSAEMVTYDITHRGPVSSSLSVFPALVWNPTRNANMAGPGDVRLFGMDYGWADPTAGDMIAVGIDAWGYWHSPQPLFAEFDLYIDHNEDGVWDYVNFNWNNGARTGAANNNTWVVVRINRATGVVSLGSPYLIYTDYNSSYMEWYLPAAGNMLGQANPTFDYQLLGFEPNASGSTPVGQFNYAAYPFDWDVSGNPGPANRNAQVMVGVNDVDGYAYSEPVGVMIVDYNGDPRNQNGAQAYYQPIELDFAWLQVAHLAPFAMDPGTAVTVTLNGAPALTDFEYGDSTGYIELPAGDYLVEIFPGSSATAAISATVTLEALNYYTAIAAGDGANQPLQLIALMDDLTPPAAGNFHLRLGHLSAFAAGAATADVRLQDGAPVLENVDFGDITGFLPLPAGTYDLKITTPGGAVTLIDPLPVTFAAGQIVSAFATGDIDNQGTSAFALPAGDPGFFLPLVTYVQYLPVMFNTHRPAEWLDLTILHTNDFHSRVDEYNRNGARCKPADATAGICIGGAPRIATAVNTVRATSPKPVLLLDAGDQFQGTLFYNLFKGDVLTETMNYIGYEAMAVGNHEFDNGPGVFASFIDGADFPIVGANIDASAEPTLAGKILPYTVFQRGGHRIGVIGITTSDTPNISSPGPNVIFNDPKTSLQATANMLTAQGIDKIIALTHLGYAEDVALAAQVTNVDVIIGGHSHSFLYNPAVPVSFGPPAVGPLTPVGAYPTVVADAAQNPVLVVTAYQWGTFLGNLNVTFGPGGIVAGWGGNPIFMGTAVAKDATLDAMLQPYRDAVATLIATPVGTTTVDLPINVAGTLICRIGECLLGNLVADAMLAKANEVEPGANYQIAFQNGGGLRAPLVTGAVTQGDVLETLPFGNTISTFELKGEYVKAALENGARLYPATNGGFAQVAGLRYVINPTQPANSRIASVDVWNGTAWAPLDMNAMYKVVTNNFMRNGGDSYTVFRDFAVNPYDFGPLLDEALADYFRANSPVTPMIEGRITFTP